MQTHKQPSDKKMVSPKNPNKAELVSKKDHEEALHDDAPMSHDGTEREVSEEDESAEEESHEEKKAAPKSNKKPLLSKGGKVKIQTLMPIRLKDGTEIAEGQTIEVSEEEAALFCDTMLEGGYNFVGTRVQGEQNLHNVYIHAKRV